MILKVWSISSDSRKKQYYRTREVDMHSGNLRIALFRGHIIWQIEVWQAGPLVTELLHVGLLKSADHGFDGHRTQDTQEKPWKNCNDIGFFSI